MKKLIALIVCLSALLAGCGSQPTETVPEETTRPRFTFPPMEVTEETEPPYDPTGDVMEDQIYYVGPTREHKSITKLFLELKDNYFKKIIYIDEGTYDMFREYKDAGIPTPPDDVESPDYFTYNAFLPPNTALIGVGNVRLEFNPKADEITYGESRTWSPLNIEGECYIENLEIYCKNGRYCIHDDGHNKFQGTTHYYKNVRTVYEYSDLDSQGRRLGFNNTIGNGIAQGAKFVFEDCHFEFKGSDKNSAFYTHESGSQPGPQSYLTFINCTFLGGPGNARTVRLQNLATANIRVETTFENCTIEGGIYLTIYKDTSAQHFDVTLINSGNPPQMIDDMANNRYPIKVIEE